MRDIILQAPNNRTVGTQLVIPPGGCLIVSVTSAEDLCLQDSAFTVCCASALLPACFYCLLLFWCLSITFVGVLQSHLQVKSNIMSLRTAVRGAVSETLLLTIAGQKLKRASPSRPATAPPLGSPALIPSRPTALLYDLEFHLAGEQPEHRHPSRLPRRRHRRIQHLLQQRPVPREQPRVPGRQPLVSIPPCCAGSCGRLQISLLTIVNQPGTPVWLPARSASDGVRQSCQQICSSNTC